MKKITLTILALVCALCCAFCLAACGDSGGKTIAVESITLSKTTLSLNVGGTETLTATVKPDDATDKKVTWSSDKTDIATVDSSGTVTAKAVGTATVTAKTSNNKSATCTVTVSSEADSNVNYTTYVSKTSWKYKETGATVTVKDEDGKEITGITAKYITEADYDLIKDSDNFKEQLIEKSQSYNADYIDAGTYYLFAECGTDVYSSLVKVAVNKGTLTINKADNLSASYTYNGKIGKVKLSELYIENDLGGDSTGSYEDGAHAAAADGTSVLGDFEWANPDVEVDCTNNGQKKAVKFVPDDDNYEVVASAAEVELTINKGYVNATRSGDGREKKAGEQGRTWDYYRPDGVSVNVDTLERYKDLVDITTNVGADTRIELSEDAVNLKILDTLTGTPTPTYTFSLKDKTNYYWVTPEVVNESVEWDNNVANHDTENIADIKLIFMVWPNPQDNYSCGLYWDGSLSINAEMEIKVWVGDPAYYYSDIGLTYNKDDIHPQIVDTFTDESGTHTTQATATVKSVGTGECVGEDGKKHERAYIVISVTDLSKGGDLCIKITGSGRIGYENVNRTECITIYGYSGTISCPINNNADLSYPANTPVSALYELFDTLETPFGKWVLHMDLGGENWWECKSDDKLPEGKNTFKLVFQPDESKGLVGSLTDSDAPDVVFYITGTTTPAETA